MCNVFHAQHYLRRVSFNPVVSVHIEFITVIFVAIATGLRFSRGLHLGWETSFHELVHNRGIEWLDQRKLLALKNLRLLAPRKLAVHSNEGKVLLTLEAYNTSRQKIVQNARRDSWVAATRENLPWLKLGPAFIFVKLAKGKRSFCNISTRISTLYLGLQKTKDTWN